MNRPGNGVPAVYYDGHSTTRHAVQLRFCAVNTLEIDGLDGIHPHTVADLPPQLGNTPRVIHLSDGGRLEITDRAASHALDAQRAALTGRAVTPHWLHRLERHWGIVIGAVVITALTVWGFMAWGIPALAQHSAQLIPQESLQRLDRQTLNSLDHTVFSASKLPDSQRQRLQRLLASAAQGNPHIHLKLRQGGPLGANAMALPSGTVVVTDELVELARSDAELLGVLAHEVGHVVGRHALRQLLQNGASALVIGVVTGDISSASSLAAALPTLLLHAHYSQQFETEADRHASRFMHAQGLDPAALGAILSRMDPDGGGYLSSHPSTAERIRQLTNPR